MKSRANSLSALDLIAIACGSDRDNGNSTVSIISSDLLEYKAAILVAMDWSSMIEFSLMRKRDR